MTPIEIRGAIMFITGLMPNDFAAQHGIPICTLHRVIKREQRTEKARVAISKAIGKTIDEIWPEEKEE